MRREPTVQANSVLKVLGAAEARGLVAEELLRAVGLPPDLAAKPEGRVPLAALIALYDEAAGRCGDETFGLSVGASSDPRMFDVLGYAALVEPTLGASFALIDRFLRVLQEGARVDLRREEAEASVRYRITDPRVREGRHETEATLAIVARFVEVATARRFRPSAVSFSHESPREVAPYAEVFGCEPRFGSDENRIVFDAAWLEVPLVAADATLARILDRHLREMLDRLPPASSFVDALREHVVAGLRAGDVEVGRIARRLGTSERTLQRRLRDEGVSYRDVVEAVRRDLALAYLREPRLSVGEVAFLLGYSDVPTFHRAFRRWTGDAPGAYRRRVGAS